MNHIDFPYLAFGLSIAAVALLIAHILSKFLPLSTTVATDSVASLEGLRGLLALSVFLSHATTSFFFWNGEPWRYPDHRLFIFLAQCGVAAFFMITSFLFSRKIMYSNGITDLTGLYIGRLFRIGPLYIVAAVFLLTLIGLASEFTLKEDPLNIALSALQLLAFGLFPIPDVNSLKDTWTLIAGTPWTLQYEWLFYASLPLMLLVTRRFSSTVLVCATALTLAGFTQISTSSGFFRKHIAISSYFFVGIMAASLQQSLRLRAWARPPAAAILVVGPLVLLGLYFRDANGPWQAIILGVAFTTIVCGNTAMGILLTRALRCMGIISYSFYLLHGCMLYLFCHLFYKPPTRYDIASFWVVALAATIASVLLSFFTYRFIELPGQKIGRTLIRRHPLVNNKSPSPDENLHHHLHPQQHAVPGSDRAVREAAGRLRV